MQNISMPQERHICGAVTPIVDVLVFAHHQKDLGAPSIGDHLLCYFLGSSNAEVDLGNMLYNSAVGICCSEM